MTSQDRYNRSKKGRARKRKYAQNMTPEQKEKQRVAKQEYMQRKRTKGEKDYEAWRHLQNQI